MIIFEIILWLVALYITFYWSYRYFKFPELSDEYKANYRLRTMLFWWMTLIYSLFYGLSSLHFIYLFPGAIIFSSLIMINFKFHSWFLYINIISLMFWFAGLQFVLEEVSLPL
tara:strand:- start:307 stop:645 length:339 start_codon:yes stop_codon:yes gene_type:complete